MLHSHWLLNSTPGRLEAPQEALRKMLPQSMCIILNGGITSDASVNRARLAEKMGCSRNYLGRHQTSLRDAYEF